MHTGGAILLLEQCLNDRKDGPASGHMWDMYYVTIKGRMLSGHEYKELLAKYGFTKDFKTIKFEGEYTYDAIFVIKE